MMRLNDTDIGHSGLLRYCEIFADGSFGALNVTVRKAAGCYSAQQRAPAQPLTVHSLQCCSLQRAGPDPRLPLQTLDTDPADSRLVLQMTHRFHNHHKGWVALRHYANQPAHPL